MAEDKDVLGKADALLRRHSVAPPRDASETGGVPLLTDLVEAPSEEAPEQPAAGDDLTQEVIELVMEKVERQLSADLERRLLDKLAPQVHSAVTGALGELRPQLANAIGDAIAEVLERRQLK